MSFIYNTNFILIIKCNKKYYIYIIDPNNKKQAAFIKEIIRRLYYFKNKL